MEQILPALIGSIIVIGAILLAVGAVIGYFARQTIAKQQAGTLEAKLEDRSKDAKREAQEILLKAKNKAVSILEEAKKEEGGLKEKLLNTQERLVRREEVVDQKLAEHEENKKLFEARIEKVREIKKEMESLRGEAEEELARVAKLTRNEAKTELFAKVEESYREEILELTKKLEKENALELDKKAKELLTQVIQRLGRSHIADVSTSTVSLPSDDLKGRIIGKEGRNVKTLEKLTGVEVLIDETPGMITLSSFDPVRRQIAKIALERLIKDGRIQPARIEDTVELAKKEIRSKIQEAGDEAVYEVGIVDLPPQIVHLLGRLNYRTSYGQNVLLHSIEAAHVAGMLASELGANVEVAKKGALVHDIGKAIDHEVEGTHVELGRKILEKYGVAREVIAAMESHHEDYPFSTPEAFIVSAAESMSAARPGARKDTLENFLKRVEGLEKIATDFPGVEKAYAIQAGREVRIFVTPEDIDDLEALKLARKVAERIQEELTYPGEIKVNVIRETRAVEYAK